MPKQLHIVSFDVPFPPNYGGVIDVFYKIKALHALGITIILHAFEYGRPHAIELEKFCLKVHYYKRNLNALNLISKTPFIVNSRANNSLINNLKCIKAPILFEGLHTTYALQKNTFQHQKVAIRTHNIEHDYYKGLSKSETKILKKVFLKTEATKLRSYEKIIAKSDYVFTISPFEQMYFSDILPNKSVYIPVFHQSSSVKMLSQKGAFALYHGDLRVSDNILAVRFLMDVFACINYPLIIASSFQNKKLLKEISEKKNIEFKKITSQNELSNLLEQAHINVLPTFQKTGIKLKLLNTLFNSRFTIANNEMIEDTGLEPLCLLANTKTEFKQAVIKLIDALYTDKEINEKRDILKAFNPLESAQKIIDTLF